MMKKIHAAELEVIRFTTEDVIVTSGAGGSGGTTDPITAPFLPDPTYFTSGDYINRSGASDKKFTDGLYYFFKVTDNGTNFGFDKSNYRTNIGQVDPSYLYAWYDNRWITENKDKSYYPSLLNTQ